MAPDLRFWRTEEELFPAVLVGGPIRLDADRHVVTVDGKAVQLPLKEFDLLELLMRNSARVLTRAQILDRVWGVTYVGAAKTVDVQVNGCAAKSSPTPPIPLHHDRPRPGLPVRALTIRYVPSSRDRKA